MKADTRHKLRIAVRTGQTFVDILTNTRKDGKRFQNLLHMSTLRIGPQLYLVGIQANATDSGLDLQKEAHRAELAMLVDRIFQSSVDVWVAMQSANFSSLTIREVPPYVYDTVQQMYTPEVYDTARDEFVALERKLYTGNEQLGMKNTFLEGFDECDPCEMISLLRKVSSEPLLHSGTTSLLDSDPEPYIPPPTFVRQDADWSHCSFETEPPLAEEIKNIGSAHHPKGCTPCSFFCYSMSGCNKGQNCEYCHEDHPKNKRRRGKKKRRGDAAQFAEIDIPHYPQDDSGSQDSARGGSQQPEATKEATEVTKQLPAATPDALVQLLGAIAWLAPLPGTPPVSTTPKLSSSSAFQSNGSAGNVIMWYNEPNVVLEVGQWKQLIPFVTTVTEESDGGEKFDPCQLEWTFEVEPELPRDFVLDTRRGVIKGFAYVAQADTAYVVVARAKSLRISMALSICVLPSSAAK
jgi:hypothetical protein